MGGAHNALKFAPRLIFLAEDVEKLVSGHERSHGKVECTRDGDEGRHDTKRQQEDHRERVVWHVITIAHVLLRPQAAFGTLRLQKKMLQEEHDKANDA